MWRRLLSATLIGTGFAGWASWVMIWWAAYLSPEKWTLLVKFSDLSEQWVEGLIFHVLALAFLIYAVQRFHELFKYK